MKFEMLEFMLHAAAPGQTQSAEFFGFHMKAPQGATILNPSERVPWYDQHARRFPGYARHPELTRGRQAAMASWVYYNQAGIAQAARFAVTRVAPVVVASVVAYEVSTTYVAPGMGGALQDAIGPTTGLGGPQTQPSWLAVPYFFVNLFF